MSELLQKTYPLLSEYFYYFSKVLENTGEVDEEFLQNTLENFTDNFTEWKLYNWEQFWSAEGFTFCETHLLPETHSPNNNDLNRIENIDIDQSLFESSAESETGTSTKELVTQDNGLWHLHEQLIHDRIFSQYSKLYYDYFKNFKIALESAIECLTDADIELDEQDILEAQRIADEFRQLKLLGLPTNFCKRRYSRGKAKRYSNDTLDSYIDVEYKEEMNEELHEVHSEEARTDSDDDVVDDKLSRIHNKTISKQTKSKSKRNRKLRGVPDFMLEEKHLLKYWRKRFTLFSRFDEGIRLDRESWYSVTPEKVAAHLARRLSFDLVVDGCCGCGGNTIQFALTCHKVIAIDNDPIKLEMAKHNAAIYGVADKIEFILDDFIEFLGSTKLKADAVFVSPPWGGPSYNKNKCYDIEKYLQPVGASILIENIRKITENIVLFLPRRSNIQQIVKLAGVGNSCEIVYNYLGTNLVAISAMYGKAIVNAENNTFIQN